MARLKSPLMSMTARKQLGHALVYKMKGNRAFCTGYSRPGSKNPFTASENQEAKREFYRQALAVWQAKTDVQKEYWNEQAKQKNLNMSGWNLFYQSAFNDPVGTLGYSTYGTRTYGQFNYGKQPLS